MLASTKFSLFICSLLIGFGFLCSGCQRNDSIKKNSSQNTTLNRRIIAYNLSPTNSHIAKVFDGSGNKIDIFGPKEANGTPIRVDHANVFIEGEEFPTTIEFDEQQRATRFLLANGGSMAIDWITDELINLTVVSFEGDLSVSTQIDLTEFEDSVNKHVATPANIRTNRPISLSAIDLPTSAPPEEGANKTMAEDVVVNVDVNVCGYPADGNSNEVRVYVRDHAYSSSHYLPTPAYVGAGRYSTTAEAYDDESGETFNDICTTIGDVMGLACTANDMVTVSSPYICSSLAVAVDLITLPAPGDGVPVFAACEAAFLALNTYCSTLGASPAPGAPDLTSFFCNSIYSILQDNPTRELQPIVRVIGISEPILGDITKVNAAMPEINLNIDAEVATHIPNFNITPADPDPGEDYVSRAVVVCGAPGATAMVSVVGTDGYEDQASVTLSGLRQELILSVPGAETGVQDVVTISIDGEAMRVAALVF